MKKTKRDDAHRKGKDLPGRVGIHEKMLIQLGIMMGLVITVIWLCQITMLVGFYQRFRSNQVHTAARMILENLDHEDLDELADRISAENEVCMMLVDENGDAILSIDHVRFCLLHRMKPQELMELISRTPRDGSELIETPNVFPFRNENYHAEDFQGHVPGNGGGSGRSMLYAKRVTFQDGSEGTLLLNAQLTPTSSVQPMLQRQILYIVLLVILLTFGMGYLMAASVSKPIIETNRAARMLSRGEYKRPPHAGGYLEIAELNDTLVHASEELKKVDALQRELIANISHDLRTPLTMIQGYAETMRDIPDEMNPDNMQIIIDETNRLSSLVNEVLEFSRMRTGDLKLVIEDFNLTEMIRQICDRVNAMTEREGYRVICEIDDNIYAEGDAARIEQVVYNFLGNALTWTGVDKRVFLKADSLEQFVRISIRDTGKGIPTEDLPYIWDRYYRTNESHRRSVIGSGLGLNICRGILDRHKAEYGVDSEPDQGTTFWFKLKKGNSLSAV